MNIKPLKPISTIIEIHTKSWFDRNFGNMYSSGRAYINLDYDNPIHIPFQHGTPDYIKHLIKEQLFEAGINTRADDVLVFYSNEETLQRYARQWGRNNG